MAKVYAVGVGPGDPELMTRKAERILRAADVIVAPVSKPHEASVALATAREVLDETRQEIVLHQFPMTADKTRLLQAWQAAAALIAARVEAGRTVAFITIGDPLFYSTFIYLLRILQASYPGIPVEIIPGISSINAAAAQAMTPLVEGDEPMTVIPATAGLERIRSALDREGTLVLLKVRPVYGEILELLRQSGRGQNTVFVERVGSGQQKVLTCLTDMERHQPDYLSLMIIRPGDNCPDNEV